MLVQGPLDGGLARAELQPRLLGLLQQPGQQLPPQLQRLLVCLRSKALPVNSSVKLIPRSDQKLPLRAIWEQRGGGSRQHLDGSQLSLQLLHGAMQQLVA